MARATRMERIAGLNVRPGCSNHCHYEVMLRKATRRGQLKMPVIISRFQRSNYLRGWIMEISLTDINAMDEISIRTQHSEYCFRVTDPNRRRGVLSGGRLGNQQCDAVLSGAILPKSLRTRSSARLEIGSRALFYIAINDGLKILALAR